MKRRHLVATILVVAAVGCGSATPPSEETAAPPARMASTPIPSPAASPPSASQAFLAGYRAYRNHDLPLAVERLGYASDHYQRLADYALYYRGLAQRDSGDLAAAASTLEKLI